MIKRLFFYPLLFISIAVSCTMVKPRNSHFVNYINDFKFDSKGKVGILKTLGLTVSFKKFKRNKRGAQTIGMCYFAKRHIDIDKEFWYNSSGIRKRALIYHEMFHCACFQYKHRNEYMNNGCPKSLMNKHITSNYCLKKYWDEYMKEAFDRC